MFGKPRQVETETELYDAAVRALMRRAYSVYEMKQMLGRRTEDDNLLQTVMDRLKRSKMIDDERFAKQFVRQRTEIRRQGKFRIARDYALAASQTATSKPLSLKPPKKLTKPPLSANASSANSAPFAAKSMNARWPQCIGASCAPAFPPTSSAANSSR